MPDLTVACVRWGDKYADDYVRRLRNMVSRTVPKHEFVCFTDDAVQDVTCRPLPSTLPTWWSKIGLFKPGVFTGDVLYLDLDVVITGKLDGMVALLETDRSKLWIRDDFSYSLRVPKVGIGADTRRLLGGPGCCNSSVMMWHGDACRAVWDEFKPEVMHELHGDQNHITRVLYPDRIAFLPNEWASSYKYGGAGTIRVFHGEPKPPQCLHDPMVAQHWT